MSKQILTGLSSDQYEHPFDRRALNILEGTPGVDSVMKKFIEMGAERMFRIQLTGSNLRVTHQNFPELNQVFESSCETLSLPVLPKLYTSWDYQVNGYTTGVENPLIALNSGCVDLLAEDELRFVIGHELGHIKSNHVLYHQMARLLPMIGRMTLGIGGLFTLGIQLSLLNWSRMSEFTADRAGLLACQNPDAAMRALLKMAGLPRKHFDDEAIVQSFLEQARDFEDFDYDAIDKIAKIFATAHKTHPYTVMRAAELNKWIESGEYDFVLEQRMKRISASVVAGAKFCPHCGGNIAEQNSFCGGCGAMIGQNIEGEIL